MVADIERDDDVWVLRIRLDNRDDDAELKTINAERTLPLHPALIEEGFLDYVAGLPNNVALFANIKPDMFGRRGRQLIKAGRPWAGSGQGGIAPSSPQGSVAFMATSLPHDYQKSPLQISEDVAGLRMRSWWRGWGGSQLW